MSKPLVFLLLLAGLRPVIASAQVRIGSEFQANTYTTDRQTDPRVASDGAGNFVVVWQSYSWDNEVRGIFARRHQSDGAPLAAEFRVNSYNEGVQSHPALASAPDGRFVVVWQSFGRDGSDYGIFGQRVDASGAFVGEEFPVNSYTTGSQRRPAVAADPSGRFVVVWSSVGQEGSPSGVFGQRYDAAGVPQGGEFRVNADTAGVHESPAVAIGAEGSFVVTWSAADGSGLGVFGRRFDAAGTPLGDEFQVNSYTTGMQRLPSLAADAGGGFVVAWSDAGQEGSGYGVFARRFDAAGASQGPEFQVNSYTLDWQTNASVAASAAGEFLVSWTSYGQDGSHNGVFGQLYDAAGAARGAEIAVNTYTTSEQGPPSAAAGSGGSFVVVWPSLEQDGDAYGVFGQRVASDSIFSDGFESGTLGAWSEAATAAGDLDVSPEAALHGTSAGLRGAIDDTTAVYVEDASPAGEDRYRARFYFDPNGFDPGQAQQHLRTRILILLGGSPSRRLAAIVLKRQGDTYSVMGRCRLDDNSEADTGFFPITDDAHSIELDWRRASAPGAADGRFELWIDGASRSVLSGLDNGLGAVDLVRLGALSVKPGAKGTLFWDEFESRRASYIGP